VSIASFQAVWQGACAGDSASDAGWSQDQVTLHFADNTPRATVTNDIDAALRRYGWHRKDTVLGSHQGPVAHWTLHQSSGSPSSAFAYPVPFTTPNWFITASWQPPGQAHRGCP
jgi:hypothetical protein